LIHTKTRAASLDWGSIPAPRHQPATSPLRFSQTAEYALRVSACLARGASNDFVRAQEIADAAAVPRDYLSKIMRRLVEAGLLESRKGHGGGFRLAHEPAAIRFVDVLSAVGYKSDADECAFGWDKCSVTDPCPLHPFWSRLRESVDQWAEENTLADFQVGGSLGS
jgi:Rrf2 family transcriptional regulator, iron-sulfur cluster assembly transcription factor